jgi:non-specific serine/threonine protein kinase
LGSPAETATLDELPRVRADVRAALAVARDGGPDADPDDALWLATMLGWDSYFRGLLAEAAVVLEVLEEASPDAHPEARDAATLSAGVVAFGLADLDRCAAMLVELAAAPDPDARRPLVAAAFLGHVARGQGRYDEAAVRYRAARDAALRAGNRRGQAWADHDLALLAMEEGRDADAEPLLRAALDLFAELDYVWGTALCACLLGAAEVRRGEVDDATQHLGLSLRLHREIGDRRGIAQCFEALAEVALARGSAATAARLVGAAVRQREVAASPPTDGEARVLEDMSRRTARDLGGSAAEREHRAGRTMPAEASLELAARLTAEADVPASATLTPRQQEVAALIAEGLTNRMIGRRLGISEKTAEIHVSNLMSRLGVPSRAGVAAWAATRPGPLIP